MDPILYDAERIIPITITHRLRDDEEELEREEDEEEALDEEEEEDEDMGGGRGGRKRRRSQFIDDVADQDDDDEEEEDDEGRRDGRRAKMLSGAEFFYDFAAVASVDEEEIEDGDDDFIVEPGADLQGEDDGRRIHRRPLLSREDEQEDVEALESSIQARYARSNHTESDEETTDKTLAVNEKEFCKYFEPGIHVKVVSGASEGAAGMVIKVEGHVVIILSDTTKEHIRVFADNVVIESAEVTTGVTRLGDYELHDLVMLDNRSFGVIICVKTEAFQVLKGVPERPEVALIRLRDIKTKLDRKNFALDRFKNKVSVKDVVRILEGPCKGKHGRVEHIFRGILFIYHRHHHEHAGFICAKSQYCMVVGGSCVNGNGDRNGGSLDSRYAQLRSPARVPRSPERLPKGPPMECIGRHRGGRGHDPLVGTTVKVHQGPFKGHDPFVGITVKVRQGPFKGYRGRVVDVEGLSVGV